MRGKMRKFSGVLLLLLLFIPAKAQLVVSLIFDNQRYMLFENVYACVTVRNDSGRPLLFGSSPELTGFVLFEVRDSRKRLIPRKKGAEISTQGLYIAPGESKKIIVPLHKYYDLSQEGFYHIHAYISHAQLPNEYRSADKAIHISHGSPVWEKVIGVPGSKGKDGIGSVERKYSICKMDGDQGKHYYLRVEDDRFIYAVTKVGTVLAYMDYEVEVDMLNRIHLLMPVAPRVYHYMSFNTDGINLENSYWKTYGTVPMLYRNPETGKVVRMGGEKAVEGVDYSKPNTGKVTISELMKSDEVRPPKDSGLVDLGAGIMPMKGADED